MLFLGNSSASEFCMPTFRNTLFRLHGRVCLKNNWGGECWGIHSLIHSVFCLTTGPKPPPKRFLHIVRSRASSFKWEYPLLPLKSYSSVLRLLPRLLLTSISPFIFPSITCFRRQFLRKMWPIQLAFRFLISCRVFEYRDHSSVFPRCREVMGVEDRVENQDQEGYRSLW